MVEHKLNKLIFSYRVAFNNFFLYFADVNKFLRYIIFTAFVLGGYLVSLAGNTGKLSDMFIENAGQVKTEKGGGADNVLFYKIGPMQLYITTSGFSALVKKHGNGKTTFSKVDFKFENATISKSQVVFVNDHSATLNIYKGRGKELTAIKGSKTVLIKNIYPGIDWLWTIDNKGTVNHDFMVNLDADASVIRYTVEGADISAPGAQLLRYSNKNLRLTEGPVVFNTREKTLPGKLIIKGNTVSYELDADLKKGGFTIDPALQLDWSNNLDTGNNTGFRSIVADDSFNTYTAGYSNDFSLPVFPQVNGSFTTQNPEDIDVVIMKTDWNQNLVWATFFGGSNNDEANAVVSTPTGIFVTGYSESWDFPIEPAILGNYDSLVHLNGRDAFISKFNSVGKLEWSTGYGGDGTDEAEDIKYYNGKIYVAGYTGSVNFPLLKLPGALNDTISLQKHTDGFLLEFDTLGNRIWATGFGGSGNDYISSVFVDATGIYTTGYTDSVETVPIPLKTLGTAYYNGSFTSGPESFITRFSLTDSLLWSTYFGGTANDITSCILRNKYGLFISGKVTDDGLPVLNGGGGSYYQPGYGGGNSDGFIAEFDPVNLNQTYCTYFGDTGTEVLTRFAGDTLGNLIFTGFSNSTLPVTNPTYYFFDQANPIGGYDGLMLGIDNNRNIFWSTLFGSSGNDFSYGLQFSDIHVVDMVGESFYNFGRDTIGGTFISDEFACPIVTSNGESNRFLNCILYPGGSGGAYLPDTVTGGCSRLQFPSLIPLKTTCPNECNGKAVIDSDNVGGCHPYAFLWSDGGQSSYDSTLCTNYWGRISDPATGQSRTIYSKFDVLRVSPVGIVYTNCSNVPDWTTLIHPAGGEPPYVVNYRGISAVSCPTTAYFGVTDSVNCVVSVSATWFQNNVNLKPFLQIDAACTLQANFNADTFNCVNTNYSQNWKYVIYSGTDTVITPFQANSNPQKITNPTHSGYYNGYLDMGDCTIPLTGIFFYTKPTYHVEITPDCANNNGALTVVVYPDVAALHYFGADTVRVTIIDSNTNNLLLNTSLVITTNGPDSISLHNLPGDNFLVSAYNNTCDSTTIHADLNALNFSFNNPFVICGDNTRLTAIVTNGLAPYSYAWSTNQTGSNFINIDSGGVYTLTVTDASHCQAIASDTVYGTRALIIDSIASLNTECPFTNGGKVAAQVYVSGGAQPYTYAWSSGEVNATANNLPVSFNNTISVTDINGCSADSTYLFNLPQPMQVTDSSFMPICYSNPTGVMNVYIVNGIAGPNGTGYNVTWIGNQQGNLGNTAATQYGGYWEATQNLAPDYYQYLVTDYYGCQFTGYDSVKVAEPITYNLDTVNCLCYGDASGSAGLVNIQSTLPYTISWSNGYSNSVIYNLRSGNYSVTLTDVNNCVYTGSVYVSQPPPLIAVIDSGLGITCHSGTAMVNINGSGGTPPYTDTATYQLGAGAYNFFITDSNRCIDNFSFSLSNPPLFSDSVWVTQPVCSNGYQGQVNVVALGGVSPFNAVVNGIDSQSFAGLGQVGPVPPGNADVVVTDAHGCTITSNVTVNANYPITGSVSASNPLCAGSNTGSVTILITNGEAPFNYNGNTFYSSYTVNNLDTGTYSFDVYDMLGCDTIFTISLTSPPLLTATDSITAPILCNGNQATIVVTAAGGVPPYNDTGTFNYSAGDYTLMVTDANGCQVSWYLSIGQPAAPLNAFIVNETPSICDNAGNNGFAQLLASGGTYPYNYYWGNGESGSSFVNDLGAGYYTYTVTDANLCQDTGSFTMYAQNGWQAVIDTTNACNGNNGTAWVILNSLGYYGGFIYQWFDQSNNPISVADTITNLAVGQYSVKVSYADGCDTTLYFNITQGQVSFTVINDTTPIVCNGGLANVTVNAFGGYPPYNGTGQYTFGTGPNVVQVSDQTGCAVNDTINLWQPQPMATTAAQYSLVCSATQGSEKLTTTGGIAPYSVYLNNNYSYYDTVTVTGPLGFYNLQVIDSLGCANNVSFTITPGNILYGSIVNSNPTCNGFNNGQTVITMQNGYLPYILNDSTYYTQTITFDSLAAGTNVYQVSDSLNCSAIFTVSLSQPAPLVIDTNVIQSEITCSGLNNAVIALNAVGGTTPYTYGLFCINPLIQISQTSNIFNNVAAGNYNVSVLDSNGCSAYLPVVIPAFLPAHDSLVVDSVNCYGSNDGFIKVYPQPDNRSPYTYSLNNGAPQVFNTFNNLVAGAYQVIVSDVNHCMDTLNVSIGQPDSIDGRVWLNGMLLPDDSINLNNRDFANFTKLSSNPWSVTFSPAIAYIQYTDSLVQVQPRENLTYTVTVYMDSNNKDCFIQYKGLIEIQELPEIPNTITPNGDGFNDVWKIDLIRYPNAVVTIFDRWGEVVYTSGNYNNDWGGVDQKSGKKLPDGTYFYLLKVPDQNNAEYRGNINIMDALR